MDSLEIHFFVPSTLFSLTDLVNIFYLSRTIHAANDIFYVWKNIFFGTGNFLDRSVRCFLDDFCSIFTFWSFFNSSLISSVIFSLFEVKKRFLTNFFSKLKWNQLFTENLNLKTFSDWISGNKNVFVLN